MSKREGKRKKKEIVSIKQFALSFYIQPYCRSCEAFLYFQLIQMCAHNTFAFDSGIFTHTYIEIRRQAPEETLYMSYIYDEQVTHFFGTIA